MIHTKKGPVFVEDTRPVSSATVRRELVVLSTALNHAVTNGRLTVAPKIVLPPPGLNKTRYLEREEIEKLLAACVEPHIKLFVALAINTGARKSALLEMQWSQVDFTRRIIYLNPEGRVQTNKRRAIVPMNNFLYETLWQTKIRSEQNAAEASEKEGVTIEPCPHIIAYRNTPVSNVKTGFRLACRRAELKGVTPHTLRHTAGTLMALAGVPLFIIAKVLGHSVQKTTELYAHFQPDYLRGAVEALQDAMPIAFLPKPETTPAAATIQ